MKIRTRLLFPFFCLFCVSLAFGASMPPLEVTVSNAGGKVVYKGTTKADGSFATGNLAPGSYVVQFLSKSGAPKGGPFALEASSGKIRMSADSLNGQRFSDPGIAMKVTVEAASAITGRIGKAGSQSASAAPSKQTAAKAHDNRPVKMINGKPYVWVRPQSSSLEGGHWVEQGSAEDVQPGSGQGTPARSAGTHY